MWPLTHFARVRAGVRFADGRRCAWPGWRSFFRLWLLSTVFMALSLPGSLRAAIQFDVFLGYDGIVPEACWFPVVCEVRNDGAAFSGVIEVKAGRMNQSQTRRLALELPTGTLKRVVIPVFSTARGLGTWDVRLLDHRGKAKAEQLDIQPRKQLSSTGTLLGAMPRSPGGVPILLPILAQQPDLQPTGVRLLGSLFPDNPLVLEALDAIYLNSEKALELTVGQVQALTAWLRSGGHLIVGIEQTSDLNGAPWLKTLVPCDLREMQTLDKHPEIQEWLRTSWPSGPVASGLRVPGAQSTKKGSSQKTDDTGGNPIKDLPDDFSFELAPMQVAVGKVREGRVEVQAGDKPLIVTAQKGAGRITVLLFSPEREPFRSWKNLPAFWARMAEVPAAYYLSSDHSQPGGWGSDGIFGAMLDSRQVHKLPVTWLLLLLLVYLVVIGPLDYWWLKRIRRPMLTWITFPCYVFVFSMGIYLIGYRLRAGESEWNELHVVDVAPGLAGADLRGRTYSSVYAPSNERYKLKSQQPFATLRGEFLGSWSGGQGSDRAVFNQVGNAFQAEVFVPVWSSQLLVSDWYQEGLAPFKVSLNRGTGDSLTVRVENRTDKPLTQATIAIGTRLFPLGDVPPGQSTTFTVRPAQGRLLTEYVQQNGAGFQGAVQSRQYAFGRTERGRIDDLVNGAVAASFLSLMAQQQSYNNFIAPPGLDLTPLLRRDLAVFLAWSADYSPAPSIKQFTPKRSQRNTLWRQAIPIPYE